MIARDYHLKTGELEDTGDRISRKEKDKTLFDIILNNLDLAMIHTKNLFTFYDDAGKLTLKNMENMKLDIMIDDKTAQDYDYKSALTAILTTRSNCIVTTVIQSKEKSI
uniref:XkdQ/YqbQ family protein n=1 Tax=Clostridium sp. NkU-1 TaxID=1095009 RepID=UPI000A7B49F0